MANPTDTTNALRALEILEAPHKHSALTRKEAAAKVRAALATTPRTGAEAKPEGVPVVQQTAPKRIWLAVSDDTHDEHQPFPDSIDGEVTWADDPVVEVCVPYVRADLARQAQGGGEETP